MTRRRSTIAAALAVIVTMSACADTVVEVDADPTATSAGPSGSAEITTVIATVPIVGSTAELLAEMSLAMSQLSAQIADEGDEQETLRRLEAIWAVARVDVEATRRDLASDIQTTVDMARNAVVRIRPADADKAVKILTDLVDRYTGDG